MIHRLSVRRLAAQIGDLLRGDLGGGATEAAGDVISPLVPTRVKARRVLSDEHLLPPPRKSTYWGEPVLAVKLDASCGGDVDGDALVLLGYDDEPLGVVRTTGVQVVRAGDVDLQFARDEGEGFETVAAWRAAHERFWADKSITDDTLIVCQRFVLSERY